MLISDLFKNKVNLTLVFKICLYLILTHVMKIINKLHHRIYHMETYKKLNDRESSVKLPEPNSSSCIRCSPATSSLILSILTSLR